MRTWNVWNLRARSPRTPEGTERGTRTSRRGNDEARILVSGWRRRRRRRRRREKTAQRDSGRRRPSRENPRSLRPLPTLSDALPAGAVRAASPRHGFRRHQNRYVFTGIYWPLFIDSEPDKWPTIPGGLRIWKSRDPHCVARAGRVFGKYFLLLGSFCGNSARSVICLSAFPLFIYLFIGSVFLQ